MTKPSAALGNTQAVTATSDVTPENCGDLGIRIDRAGRWYYHGSPIRRQEMVCLFASMLSRREDGGFWLVTADEMGRIEVEDAPFLAVEMFACGSGRDMVVSFRTNVDEVVTVDAGHPLRMAWDAETERPVLYVHLRDGIEARLTGPVYSELISQAFEETGVEDGVGDDGQYGLWSSGIFFPLRLATGRD